MKEYKFTGKIRPSSIYIDNDSRIYELYQRMKSSNLNCEVTIRVPDPRQDWIDLWYRRAMTAVDHLGSCVLRFCKDTTIMVERNPFPNITTSAPRHGDKYDRKTGIAVCYAKMRGATVPDYI